MPCNAKNEGKEWPAGFNALSNIFFLSKVHGVLVFC